MESGIYIARISRVVIVSDGLASSGKRWIIFLLTLEIFVEKKKYIIKYCQPSWSFADIFAEFFGSAKNDFDNWNQLHNKSVYVYLQGNEDPTIIDFVK